MKLSIIIPAYNAEPYIYELIDCLVPQLNKNTEVIIVDDGSKVPLEIKQPHIKLIRKENGGVSSARNVGIENSKGEYISFIDADDLVADDYVQQIISKMPFDYLEMSWKAIPGNGAQYNVKLNSEKDRLLNPSACTRAFNRSFIGDVRFNENKDSAEDEEFTRRLNLDSGDRAVVTDYLYFYRTYVENSGSKRSMRGETNTQRIVYHYPYITSDMVWLIEEVKKEDEKNEVIIMTDRNDLPELKKYARITTPHRIRGMELRGVPTYLFHKIDVPIKTQVCLYKQCINRMGGIETFIYNFCSVMSEFYDITVLCDRGDDKQISRLRKKVRVSVGGTVTCDVLIMNSILESIPKTVTFEKSIQMVHCCKLHDNWRIPQDRDMYVNVSKVSQDTFKGEIDSLQNIFTKECHIIHNVTFKEEITSPLLLVTAARVGSSEKGAARMKKLAELFNKYHMPYVWLYFSDAEIRNCPANLIRMDATLDIKGWIAKADYVVQLSDIEAYGYTMIEAMECGTPIITTPIEVLEEIGFKEGKHGFIVPFDMNLCEADIQDIFNTKFKFNYRNDTEISIEKWKGIL